MSGMGEVKEAGKLIFFFLILAAVATLVVPILYGTGATSATQLGVGVSNLTNLTVVAAEQTAQTQGNVFSYIPYVGVGLAIMAALGVKLKLM